MAASQVSQSKHSGEYMVPYGIQFDVSYQPLPKTPVSSVPPLFIIDAQLGREYVGQTFLPWKEEEPSLIKLWKFGVF